MSSIASVLLLALCLVCTAQAWRYQPVGPSLSPAPVSASQIAKVTNVATDIRRRWEQLDASCDARAVFALAYVHMTESITRFIQNNYFDDGNSMADFVVELANKYTTTFDAWAAADVAQVSGAWAEAYSWTVYGDSNATEDLLLGLNAHMGYDLAVTTFNMKYYEPSKKADYDRVNDQINAVLYNASTDLSQRYDPLLAPSRIEGGITNYLLPKIISWRADAMKSAILFSLAQTTSQLEVFAKGCDNAASLKAYTFQQAKASTAEARFDYCKENQPQAKARSLAAALAAAAAAAAAPVRSAAPAPKDSNAEEVVVAPPDASAKGLPNVRVEGGFTSLLAGLKL